jgi:hypothetical protein
LTSLPVPASKNEDTERGLTEDNAAPKGEAFSVEEWKGRRRRSLEVVSVVAVAAAAPLLLLLLRVDPSRHLHGHSMPMAMTRLFNCCEIIGS